MSSTSRIPLAASSSANRESALIRSTAQKIKRKSIGPPNFASAIKRPRALAITPTSQAAPTGNVTATARSFRLGNAMMTGRATTIGVPSSRPGSSIRAPTTFNRQRTTSSSTLPPKVDEEKEEMKRKLLEMEKRAEEQEQMLKETKIELSEAKDTIKELKNDLKTEKEEHAESKEKKDKYIEELKKEAIDKDDQMRTLHNDVVDLRGRIRVSVRVRPLLHSEGGESTEHLSYPDETTVGIEQQKGKVQPFGFNHVFRPTYSQQQIFEGVKDLILSVLHGFNVSLISYGQTGSGKTHTMRGGEGDAAGLIPRAVRFLFENRTRLEALDWSFNFAASFLEVYNNECFDLLSTPPRAKREIKQVNKKFVVDGLTWEPIIDELKMSSLLRQSDSNRSTAATKCNESSSRSHAVFALSVKGVNGTTGAKIDCVLKLVDLAGSERASESGAVGERFTEMTHINSALSSLQNCIRAILSKQTHVPYRNSKLTTLLQDSLSGGSKCMVILSLSPQLTTINETRRTLEFGRNLSQTHIGAAKKKKET